MYGSRHMHLGHNLYTLGLVFRSPYNRKSALDAGDYGLGFAANSLELGCDCLGEVTYFDGVVNDAAGEPVVIKNAVCLHEEDHGLLWKHLDYR